jgi:hypothetical protein
MSKRSKRMPKLMTLRGVAPSFFRRRDRIRAAAPHSLTRLESSA